MGKRRCGDGTHVRSMPSLLIDGEERGHFLIVSDYIHMNPVRVKRVRELKSLLKDRESSAGWLAGSLKAKPHWLRWERVYGELEMSNWKGGSRRQYREYLGRRISEVRQQPEIWKKIRRGWCLGSEGFISRMKDLLEEMSEQPHERDSWAGSAVEEMEEDRAIRVLEKGMKLMGYNKVEEIRGQDRYLLAKLVRHQTRVRIPWLAQKFSFLHRGSVSHGISRIAQRLERDKKLNERWKELLSQNVA